MSSSRSLGTLTIDLIAKLGGFESGMDRAARTSKRTSDQVGDDAERAAARAKAAYGGLATLAIGALGGLSAGAIFKTIIDETKMAEQEQAQLAAVLRSTGEAAGFNRDQLNSMAASLEGRSIYSAGDINQAQTALLAFTGVIGGEFVRAQQAAADMSSRTGMAIQAASETIGRALDVPSEGLASLSRQGFRFTQAQKDLVAQLESTGQAGKAQAIILDALESTYGGAAQAARDTFGGALDGLRNTISSLLTAEDGSLEGARSAVEALNLELSSPAAAQAFSSLVSSIASGAGLLVRALAGIPWEHATTAATALAVVVGGRLASSAAASALSMAAAAVEAARYQAALATMAGVSARAATGIAAVSVAARAASGAMALLGGPLGAAIAAAAAIAFFATRSSEAEREAEALDGRINQLDGSFKNLTVNQAAAAIRDYTVKLDSAKENVTDLEDRVKLLTKEIERHPDAPDFKEWQNALIDAKRDLDNGRQAVDGLIGKINELNALAAMPPAVPSAAAASAVYTEMAAKINEQILLTGKRTDADKLQARIGAGLVKGLSDGEGEKLIALQRTADAKAAQEKADLAREAKAKSAAAAAVTAAQSAAKATEQRAADAVRDYQRQIELINTTTDKRKQATEVEKLSFDIESGKLADISEKRKAQLLLLAAELDAKIKLKRENEDAVKLAAFAATLSERNQTVRGGFELELAGAGMGDKYKERLKETLAIQQEFNREMRDLQAQLNKGEITQELYEKETDLMRVALAERMDLQREYYELQDEAQSNWLDGVSSAWENYRDTATDYQQQAADFTAGTLDDLTTSIGDNLTAMALEGQSLGDTFKNVASTMATSVVNALAEMAAQWLVYQAIQLATGQAGQAASIAAAAVTGTSIAAAYAPAAAMASLASFGANSAPATAGIIATTSVAESLALLGMAHDGIDSVPQTGTWLLEKGERVTTAETSAKLDSVLSRVDRGMSRSGSGSPVVNLIEDRSRAGEVERSTGLNREEVLNIFVSDIRSGGQSAKALEMTYPIKRVGR